jgi:hypothetical protein
MVEMLKETFKVTKLTCSLVLEQDMLLKDIDIKSCYQTNARHLRGGKEGGGQTELRPGTAKSIACLIYSLFKCHIAAAIHLTCLDKNYHASWLGFGR